MKISKTLLTISSVFCSLVLILTLLDFAAFHDIWNEYVSRQMIERFKITNALNLMDSSGTVPEWTLVAISYVARILFFIYFIFVLIYWWIKIPGIKAISGITLFICIAVLWLTILDFGAMQNIYRDYICPNIIKRFNLINTLKLPDWTFVAKEWTLLNISYFSRLLFIIYSIIFLIYLSRKISLINEAFEK